MKILIIARSYYPEESVVNKIAEGLFKLGHTVTVLTAKPSSKLGHITPGYKGLSYELVNGVRVHRVDTKPRRESRISRTLNNLYFLRNSRKWVKSTKEKFDVVYSYCYSPSNNLSSGSLYKKKNHVPHIAHLISVSPDDLCAKRYTYKYSVSYLYSYFYTRHMYKKVDELIVSSPIYEEYIKKVLRLKNVKTTFIPNPPLIEEGIVNPYPYQEGFNIAYYGDIDKFHALHIISEAMNKVSHQNIFIHLYGKGKYSKDLLEDIKSYGLLGHVILHGNKALSDIPNYFKTADACCVSLSKKGYAGKAIDDKLIYAMGQKKPIIYIGEGDGAELLKETGGGYVLKENVDDLVFVLNKIASTDKKELEKKGNSNYNYFLEHFQINKIINKIESILLKKGL